MRVIKSTICKQLVFSFTLPKNAFTKTKIQIIGTKNYWQISLILEIVKKNTKHIQVKEEEC